MKKQNLPDIKKEMAKKTVSPEARKKAIIIAILSFVNIFIYFGVVPALPPLLQFIIHIAYMAIFGSSLVVYVIYNRAFTRKGITIEMLPDVWNAEKKAAYIQDGEDRLKKSQWLMYLIIPFLCPIGVDALILFVWDPYLSGAVSQIIGG